MKYATPAISAFIGISSLLFLNSCVSTDTIEPEPTGQNTKEIILNLAAPAEANTRADGNYKLRYTAKLFNASGSGIGSLIERKELIEGQKSEEGVENQIIFKVGTFEKPNNFTILLFADYIPADYQPTTNGLYKDYHYDTQVTKDNKDRITMLTTPGNSSTTAISENFFNNDNYDCFGARLIIPKEMERVDKLVTLKRMVAKVKVVDNSDRSSPCQIKIKQLGLFYQLNQAFDEDKEPLTSLIKQFNLNQTLSKEITDDGRELFYYYTFAERFESSTKRSVNLSFDITDPESNIREVNGNDISVTQNYITTVTGKFLPSIIVNEPEPEPDSKNGHIYLNMSVNKDKWESKEHSWNN